jgi:ubiquinone/menaquinone biosynthesis C-methylase UbiE
MPEHICHPWVGYLLASPVRKLWQNPEKILTPYVQEGMTALDVGSAMGYFTLPLARMVGEAGKVYAVDVQEKMLTVLEKRARKAGLSKRIETRLCPPDSLGIRDLAGRVDFALVFAAAHEMPDQVRLFAEIAAALKPDGTLLLAEPKGHVKQASFEQTLDLARQQGLTVNDRPKIWGSHSAVLKRSNG